MCEQPALMNILWHTAHVESLYGLNDVDLSKQRYSFQTGLKRLLYWLCRVTMHVTMIPGYHVH